MEFHLRVPPEKWCVTKAEFFDFVEEVRDRWAEGRSNARRSTANLPCPCDCGLLEDEGVGPNLYEVNDNFVKPLTQEAGGMSYALMKHPNGLLCQVFVSHAWAEGVFELADHVRRAWPRMQRRHNLYCCLLGNPQNLDMSTWLDAPPAESPFARAMQCASHVLIIPNSTVSIYTRLWCVYEAYLGTKYQKPCIVPMRPRASLRCSTLLRTIVLPMFLGAMSGVALVLLPLPELLLFKLACAVFLASFWMTVLCFAIKPRFNLKANWQHWLEPSKHVLRSIHIMLILVLTLAAFPWASMPGLSIAVPSHFDHYYVFFGTWLFNVLWVAQLNEELLEGRELERQATNLHFTCLEDATCSNPRDEARIRGAISGFEHEVETAIQILMHAGAYNDSLRRAFQSGSNIAGLGTTDLVMKTSIAALLWLLCAAHCFALFILHTNPDCFPAEGESHARFSQAVTSAIFCTAIAILLPVIAFLLERQRGPDQGVLAARVWIIFGTYALGVPAVVGFSDFLIQRGLWFLELPHESAFCPSALVEFTLIWFPVIMAIGAAAFLMLEQNEWRCGSREVSGSESGSDGESSAS